MSRLAAAVNGLWLASSAAEALRFRRGLADPARCQRRLLRATLCRNAGTDWGHRHDFASVTDPDDYASTQPLTTWEDYEEPVERIRRGEGNVLTRAPVTLLEPTSGSTSAAKLIPYTPTLKAEFNRGLAPWIGDMMRRRPGLLCGPAYWSVSPAGPQANHGVSAVRIGFDDDSEYLGRWLGPLVGAALAVPAGVRHIGDIETFRYVTLLYLLRARSLRLISVWHPSFLCLLLRALPTHWPALLQDLRSGTVTPPGPLAPALRRSFSDSMRPQERRAKELTRLDPGRPETLWPKLGLVSCWADGHARHGLADLRRLLPTVPIQPKGLIATEALVTIPWAGRNLLAIRSHYYEFLADDGTVHPVDDVESGRSYEVIVTTGGGLYRYRLGDRVLVTEIHERTPALRFLGRGERVSDLRGEKLGEPFVAGVLADLLADRKTPFAMLAPESRTPVPGYTLYLEGKATAGLAKDLERALSENPHYRWCVRLGQLGPARLQRVGEGAFEAYLARCRRLGRRAGDVKPTALSRRDGWNRWLPVKADDVARNLEVAP